MPVRYPNPPPEATESARHGVRQLLSKKNLRGGLDVLGGSALAGVELRAPHEVFVLGATDVLNGRGLAAATSAGWAYLVIDRDTIVASAETASGGDGTYAFSQLSRGAINQAVAGAILRLEDAFEADEEYEVRVLRIPAAYSVSLWLHAESSDELVPIAPSPRGLVPGRHYSPDALFAALRPHLEATASDDDTMGG